MVRRIARHLACAAGVASLGACERGGDMRDQPRYEAMEPSEVFADGTSARPPVPGTVSRDGWMDNPSLHTGLIDGRFVERVPLEVTPALLARGRERFDIFCSPCHGYDGEGHGMVVERGYTAPPSFHIGRMRAAPDGYIFNVITDGLGRMPPYGAQVPVADRWSIIAYVRALQLSRHAGIATLGESERRRLGEATP